MNPSTPAFGVPGIVEATRLLAEAADVEWLVPGLLPAGSVIIAAAAPKTGKSLAAMNLGLAIARGAEFLGRPTTRRKVVYVALEDGRARVARRFKQLGLSEFDDLEFYALFDAAQTKGLLAAIEKSPEPLFVVIDPLIVLESQLDVKDENVALDIEKLFARLRSAAQKSRSTILLIHHFRKAGDTMRGSVALEGSSDGWWLLHRKKRSGVVRVSVTLRDAEDTETAFEMVHEQDQLTFERHQLPAEEDDDSAGTAERERIVALLQARSPATLSQQALADALDMSKSAVQMHVAALEKAGRVSRPGGKKGGYTAPPPPPSDLYD